MIPRLGFLAAALALLLADTAAAATLRIARPDGYQQVLEYRAGRGVTNRLTVERLEEADRAGPWIRIRERREPLTVRARNCRRVDPHTARCRTTRVYAMRAILGSGGDRLRVSGYVELEVRAGDGDDHVRAGNFGDVYGGRGSDAAWGLNLYGGEGDDQLYGRGDQFDAENTLLGGPGDDRIRGARDDDVLVGGPGRDRLSGGRGTDSLIDGETDEQRTNDVYDGGPGFDSVSYYYGRYEGLRLDLGSVLIDGQDSATGVEAAAGGRGHDELIGDGRRNELSGAAGQDRLLGGGGDDELHGGRGEDVLEGGSGDDSLEGARDHDVLRAGPGDDFIDAFDIDSSSSSFPYYPFTPDELDCGDGADEIRASAVDRAVGCERARDFEGKLTVVTQPVVRPGEAVFSVACDGFTAAAGCAVTITLRGARTGIAFGTATGEFREESGGGPYSGEVAVPLNERGREAFRRGSLVQVDLDPVRPVRYEESPWPTGYRLLMQGEA